MARRIRFDEAPPEGKRQHDRMRPLVTPTMAAHIERLASDFDVSQNSMAHVLLWIGLREVLAEPRMLAAAMHKKIGPLADTC